MSDVERPTLLLVDDDADFREVMSSSLKRRGFDVTTAANASEAEAAARATVFEYALVDVRMPEMSGLELVPRLREIDDGTRIVMLTGYGTIKNAVDAMKVGAIDYLMKPVDAATCEATLLGRAPSESEPDAVPSLDRVEWEYLQRVISDCDGNISEAARRLRMHRRSLQRKIAKNPPAR